GNGVSVASGAPVSVEAFASAPAGVASVKLQLDTQSIVLTRPPWKYIFQAPNARNTVRSIQVRAQANDVKGRTTAPDIRTIKTNPDTAASPQISLSSEPVGPVFLGGSTLHASGSADGGLVDAVAVSVAGAPIGSSAGGPVDAVLPLGPEGAAVHVQTTAATAGDTESTAQVDGTLAGFASGPAGRWPGGARAAAR